MSEKKRDAGYRAALTGAKGTVRLLIYVCVILVIILAAKTSYQFGHDVFAEEPVASRGKGKEVTVQVRSGMEAKELGELLKDNGLIDESLLVFEVQYRLSGYYGGWLERILMRFTDVVMSMPRLILAFAFVAMLGPGLVNGALALALTTWPAYARQARSEIQRLRHSDYLAAAEMLGIRGGRLLVGHILPLCLPSAIVRLALDLAGIILAAAGLGFLGLGARPPMAEWGAMIADGMQVIFDQWWIAAIPGAAILLASLAFNLLGDGLRDILEPQHD